MTKKKDPSLFKSAQKQIAQQAKQISAVQFLNGIRLAKSCDLVRMINMKSDDVDHLKPETLTLEGSFVVIDSKIYVPLSNVVWLSL
jgi:hypothetical protein